MKRLRILRRWFKRRFGYARLLCVGLLIGFAALRIADPAPIEEFRVRTFDTFQVIDPRVKAARPVRRGLSRAGECRRQGQRGAAKAAIVAKLQ